MRKLTTFQIKEARERVLTGDTVRGMAQEYGIAADNLSLALKGRTYAPTAPEDQVLVARVRAAMWRPREKHGLCGTPLHRAWSSMKSRCCDGKNKQYARYGGRGITVCKEWAESFTAFRAWAMHNGWEEGLQLDRRNNNKGYSPANCRFVTAATNMQNRASCRLVAAEVREMRRLWSAGEHTQSQLAAMFNVARGTVSDVVRRHSWKNI